jgi:hypothetical protein
MLTLKPQDIVVLLKVIACAMTGRASWTIAKLSAELFLSPSEVHAALQRAERARLYNAQERIVRLDAFEDFVFHGLQYVFFVSKGDLTRGMPTSTAAPPLVGKHFDEPETPLVWPHPMGVKRGTAFTALYKRVPDAAAADGLLYELVALIDALREGSARVRTVATAELKQHFAAYKLCLDEKK